MNILDIVVILAVGGFMISGYMRGLARTCFNLLSFAISLAVTNAIYPHVSRYLRGTPAIYGAIKDYISGRIGLQSYIGETTLQGKTEFIQALSLPDLLRDGLLSSNNDEFYKLLNVDTLEGYIAGYLGNACINVISMILVFIAVSIIMRVIYKMLGIIDMLPVIGTFNRLGGLAFGFCLGTLAVWLGLTVYTVLGQGHNLTALLNDSIIAVEFYNRNIFMDMVIKFFT